MTGGPVNNNGSSVLSGGENVPGDMGTTGYSSDMNALYTGMQELTKQAQMDQDKARQEREKAAQLKNEQAKQVIEAKEKEIKEDISSAREQVSPGQMRYSLPAGAVPGNYTYLIKKK